MTKDEQVRIKNILLNSKKELKEIKQQSKDGNESSSKGKQIDAQTKVIWATCLLNLQHTK